MYVNIIPFVTIPKPTENLHEAIFLPGRPNYRLVVFEQPKLINFEEKGKR